MCSGKVKRYKFMILYATILYTCPCFLNLFLELFNADFQVALLSELISTNSCNLIPTPDVWVIEIRIIELYSLK